MKPWQAILMQPWQEQRQQGQLWFTMLLAAVVVGAPLTVRLLTGSWRLTSMVGASIAVCIIFVWWGLFVRSAVLQNHPANAVLVPRLRQRLWRLTCTLWIAVCVVAASVGSLVIGHFGLLLCGFAIFLMYVVAVQRYPGLAFLPLGIIIVNAVASGRIIAAAEWLGETLGENGLVAAGLVLSALLAVALLPRIFPAGGDSHHAWHARLLSSMAQVKEGSLTGGQPGRLGRTVLQLLNGPYWQRFERDVRPGGGAGQQAIMLHALGARTQAGSVLACALVLGLVFLSTSGKSFDGKAYEFINVFLVPFGVLPSLLFPMQQRMAMQRTATEQGLLRLAPGMPPMQEFNRVLGIALAKYFFFTWLLSLALIAGASMVATRSLWVPHALPAMAVLGLGAGAFSLRDYASLPKIGNGGNALLLPMGGAIATAILAAMLGSRLPWIWFSLAGLPLVAGLWWSRWRKMLAARPAFPAARG